jgi:hypothetical protein
MSMSLIPLIWLTGIDHVRFDPPSVSIFAGMTILVLTCNSVAALCFRALSTGWSMYIIWRTGDVRIRFDTLLNSPDSPCQVPVDTLFPSYFESREILQVSLATFVS